MIRVGELARALTELAQGVHTLDQSEIEAAIEHLNEVVSPQTIEDLDTLVSALADAVEHDSAAREELDAALVALGSAIAAVYLAADLPELPPRMANVLASLRWLAPIMVFVALTGYWKEWDVRDPIPPPRPQMVLVEHGDPAPHVHRETIEPDAPAPAVRVAPSGEPGEISDRIRAVATKARKRWPGHSVCDLLLEAYKDLPAGLDSALGAVNARLALSGGGKRLGQGETDLLEWHVRGLDPALAPAFLVRPIDPAASPQDLVVAALLEAAEDVAS